MFKPAACSYGSEANKMTIFPAGTTQALQELNIKTVCFVSHPLFSNCSFLHISFMNMFIPITMLIANFRLLLGYLISLTYGQFSVRGDEPLNPTITELCSSPSSTHWVCPKSENIDCPSTNHITTWSLL